MLMLGVGSEKALRALAAQGRLRRTYLTHGGRRRVFYEREGVEEELNRRHLCKCQDCRRARQREASRAWRARKREEMTERGETKPPPCRCQDCRRKRHREYMRLWRAEKKVKDDRPTNRDD